MRGWDDKLDPAGPVGRTIGAGKGVDSRPFLEDFEQRNIELPSAVVNQSVKYRRE